MYTLTFLGAATADMKPFVEKLLGRSVTRCSPTVIAPYLNERDVRIYFVGFTMHLKIMLTFIQIYTFLAFYRRPMVESLIKMIK